LVYPEPEKVAYWYFRLNGFFQIENFVVHPATSDSQRTDDAEAGRAALQRPTAKRIHSLSDHAGETGMRWGLRLLAGLAVWLAASASFGAEAGPSREETLMLQQRLTDAGCYHGAIDGAPSAALDAAVKACPDQRPVLRIETGMHTAPINFLGVDSACTRLATTSNDKTVRVWSLPDGRLERTMRLPIGAGDGGKIYAAAVSADGRWLAAGGRDASYEETHTHGLSLVDLQTGMVRRLGAFENVIQKIALSTDDRRVAVGLGGKAGLRVLDSASGAELLSDRDYGDDIYASRLPRTDRSSRRVTMARCSAMRQTFG
jgi:hypothetical protein